MSNIPYPKNNATLIRSCLDWILPPYYVLILILPTISFTSCFSASPNPPYEVSIESEVANGAPLSLEKIGSDPTLYEITESGRNEALKIYGTAIEQCGIKQYVPSIATTRQLLVGFADLNIQSQELLTLGEKKVLRSEMNATLDRQPFHLLTYTLRQGECVRDFAFWYIHSEQREEETFRIRSLLEENISSLKGIS